MITASLALLTLAAEAPPGAELFERTRIHMAESLARQTNYVCLETVDRSERTSSKAKLMPVDSLALEVAFVEGRELHAWPGAQKFDETDLLDLAPADAAIASGAFAGHIQNLLKPGVPTLYASDWDTASRKRYARFRFTVPGERSRFMVMRSRDKGDVVGYSGEIWIDAEQSLITSIKLHTDAAPGGISVATFIEYGWVRLDNRRAWLPIHSVDELVSATGGSERNEIQFSHCRAFTGRSTVRFEAAESAGPDVNEAMQIPPGIGFELQFNEAIDSNKLRVGERVKADLATDIKYQGTVLFPRGSIVDARFVRLQKRKAEVMVQLALGEVQSEHAGTARLLAIPDPGAAERTINSQRIERLQSDVEITGDIKHPGLGTIYIRGVWLQLPKGHRTAWVTAPSPRLAKEERH